MELIIFERKAFEEFATKIEQFILRVSNSPVVKNGKKKTNNWLDHQDVCQRLKISKRTLQTLRDNGTLAYTKIGNRTYYLPEDVDSIITKVEDRRKEAKWKGAAIASSSANAGRAPSAKIRSGEKKRETDITFFLSNG